MPALGFKISDDGTTLGGFTLYEWKIDRPNNEPFYVSLSVHADADKIHTMAIASAMAPRKARSLMPNLNRVAVVSSPVMDPSRPGERADEKLNAALKDALAMAKEWVAIPKWLARYGWGE